MFIVSKIRPRRLTSVKLCALWEQTYDLCWAQRAGSHWTQGEGGSLCVSASSSLLAQPLSPPGCLWGLLDWGIFKACLPWRHLWVLWRNLPPWSSHLIVPSLRSTFLPWLLLRMPHCKGETLLSSFRWQSVLPDEVATTVSLIQVSFLRLTSALPAPDKAIALHRNLLHNLQGPVQSGNAEPLAQSLWGISRWPQ